MNHGAIKKFIILTLFLAPGILSLPATCAFYFTFGAEMLYNHHLSIKVGVFVVLSAFSVAQVIGHKLWWRTIKLARGKLTGAQQVDLWGDHATFNAVLCVSCVAAFGLLRVMFPSGGRGNIDSESVAFMVSMAAGQITLSGLARWMRKHTAQEDVEDQRLEVFL